jgi:hypothetical protein
MASLEIKSPDTDGVLHPDAQPQLTTEGSIGIDASHQSENESGTASFADLIFIIQEFRGILRPLEDFLTTSGLFLSSSEFTSFFDIITDLRKSVVEIETNVFHHRRPLVHIARDSKCAMLPSYQMQEIEAIAFRRLRRVVGMTSSLFGAKPEYLTSKAALDSFIQRVEAQRREIASLFGLDIDALQETSEAPTDSTSV